MTERVTKWGTGIASRSTGARKPYYEQRQRLLTTLAGAAVHDTLAVMRITHPSLLGRCRFCEISASSDWHAACQFTPGPNPVAESGS